jgi:hypothetical protein
MVFSATICIQNVEAQVIKDPPQKSVDDAINAIEDKLSEYKETSSYKRSAKNRAATEYAEGVLENLKNLNREGRIKSVDGLSDESEKIFRYNGKRSSPLGAYCPPWDSTIVELYNETSGQWEKCPQDIIIMDSDLFDISGDDDFENCTLLWEFADILYHEKMHEVVVHRERDIALEMAEKDIQKRGSIPENYKEEIRKRYQEKAIKDSLGDKAHSEVYNAQKGIVTMHLIVVKEELKELKKTKKSRDENKDRIDELENKKKWLEDRIRFLRSAKSHATMFNLDDLHSDDNCSIPDAPTDGVLSLHLVSPEGYSKYGVLFSSGNVTNVTMVEELFGDEIESLDSFQGEPMTYLLTQDYLFTSLAVQESRCEMLQDALDSGDLVAISPSESNSIYNHVPRQMTFSFIDAFDDTPLEDAKIQMFDSSGNMVAEFDPSVNDGEYTGVFAPDDYYFEVSTELFWIDIILQETQVISTGGEADVIIFKVDLVFIKLEYLDWLVYGATALLMLGVASRARRFWRPPLPRAAPPPMAVPLVPLLKKKKQDQEEDTTQNIIHYDTQ